MSAIAEAIQRAHRFNESGDYRAALGELDAAVEMDPINADALAAKAWALENLGTECLPAARSAYAAVLALRRDDLWARLGLANVLRRLGDVDEAARMFREIEEAGRDRMIAEPELLELVGWCQYRLGRHARAIQTFEAALVNDEHWISVRFDLALAQLTAGLRERAEASYADGIARARGRTDRGGLMHVALDDLREAMAERPEFASSPDVHRLYDMLVRELDPSTGRNHPLHDSRPGSPG
ncbi:MAG TPA: tetratricopeptide repeat protein [Actinomycetota bacterium]